MTARDQVLALLDDETRVSSEQRAVVVHDRDGFALACPGSGKTRTVGLRLAWASVDGLNRRIAATSYTNVAVEEMRRAAAEAGVVLGDEHYVGTLHSFLLRYVVYPFGHLEMACGEVPRVVMDSRRTAVTIDDVRVVAGGAGIPIWNFHFRPDDSLTVDVPQTLALSVDEALARGETQARALKRQLFERGLLSPSDAMYIAMRVLAQHDHIAASLSHRFDEVVVDEAQDTYSVQFACLDAMKANNLTSVVLAGDIDQAIYGWMGATPEGCEEFAARHDLTELPLTRNFRSSQAICNVTVFFSSRDAADVASGASAEFGVNPEIFLYDGSRPADAVAFFLSRVEELGLNQEHVAVLVRTIAFAERVNGTVSANASRAVLALGEAAEAFQAGRPLERRMIQNLEDAISEIAWGEAGLRSRSLDERTALRAQVLALLELLPALAGNLQAWIAGARSAVASAVTPLSSQPAVPPGNRVRARPGDGTVDATTAFRAGRDDPRRARTIHSAKGESRDSVLLLAQRPAGGRDFPREWVQHLLGGPRTEETRIAYVALTRARRYIAVALPTGTPDEVVGAYLDAGFVLAE